jgi:hypothetical protein
MLVVELPGPMGQEGGVLRAWERSRLPPPCPTPATLLRLANMGDVAMPRRTFGAFLDVVDA